MKPLVMVNLKVLLLDSDYYALQAIDGYLAWDRRTRVTWMGESADDMWRYLGKMPLAELPDVVMIDADHLGGATALKGQIERLRARISRLIVIGMARTADPALIGAAFDGGARGYLLKGEVRLQIAWAIVYALDKRFIVTPQVAEVGERIFRTRMIHPDVLPPQRDYPQMTGRVRQAIELCVVKGMPAHLAADEMGISLHTIRSYVKEGYRVLEAYDETEYPKDMSPQERAFMRLTSFSDKG